VIAANLLADACQGGQDHRTWPRAERGAVTLCPCSVGRLLLPNAEAGALQSRRWTANTEKCARRSCGSM